MSLALYGASVNALGTLLDSAKAFGSSPLDLTNPLYDTSTVVLYGSQSLTILEAINMGLLQRNPTTGVLEELNPAQPATRVG